MTSHNCVKVTFHEWDEMPDIIGGSALDTLVRDTDLFPTPPDRSKFVFIVTEERCAPPDDHLPHTVYADYDRGKSTWRMFTLDVSADAAWERGGYVGPEPGWVERQLS